MTGWTGKLFVVYFKIGLWL